MYREYQSLDTEITFEKYLYWRTMVGSRNFAKSQKELGMVWFADMLNGAPCQKMVNVDWSYMKEGYKMTTVKNIRAGDQLFDSYGVHSALEWLMFYGAVPKEISNEHRVAFLLGTCTDNMSGLVPPEAHKSGKEASFEFCIEHDFESGTQEMLSLMRFVTDETRDETKGPHKTLNNYKYQPKTKEHEIRALKRFQTYLVTQMNPRNAAKSLRDFIAFERSVIMEVKRKCGEAIAILELHDISTALLAADIAELGAYTQTIKQLATL